MEQWPNIASAGAQAEREAIRHRRRARVIDRRGALWLPEPRLLVVSDLHLEKGSSFARRGMLLPPYDTGATLAGACTP